MDRERVVVLDLPVSMDLSWIPEHVDLTRQSSLFLVMGLAKQMDVDLEEVGLKFDFLPSNAD